MWVSDDYDLQRSLQFYFEDLVASEELFLRAFRLRSEMFEEYNYKEYLKGKLLLGSFGIGRVGASGDAVNGITKFLALLTQYKGKVDACVSFTKDLLRESGIAFIQDKDGNIRLYYEIATKERPNELHWNYTLNEGETVIARLHVHYERDGINGVDAFSVFDEVNGGGDLISAISGYDQSNGKGFIEAMISTESNMLYILEVSTLEQRNAINDGIYHSLDLRPWVNSIVTWYGNQIANYTNEQLRTGIYGNFYMKPYKLDPNLKKPDKFIIH